MTKFYQWLASVLPVQLVYFAYIRFMAHATTTDEGRALTPDQITFNKAVDLWERTYGKQ